MDIPDHPIIQAMERDGYLPGQEPCEATCPVCGKLCDTFYRSSWWNEIVGCDNCISREDSYTFEDDG